jgi:hypothetical protein
LLATSNQIPVPNNTLTWYSYAITYDGAPNTDYWLAIMTDSSNCYFAYDAETDLGRIAYAALTFPNPPSPYISGSTVSYKLSVYAVYTGTAQNIANNTQYTCYQSPKSIYINGGTVSSVIVDGQTVFTQTNCMVTLQCGDTFKAIWSSAPTITVFGQ